MQILQSLQQDALMHNRVELLHFPESILQDLILLLIAIATFKTLSVFISLLWQFF